MSGRELAGFFDLVERVGCVRLPASTLFQSSSMGALAALRAEHVLEDGTPAEALPCPHKAGCTREVRDTWERTKPARLLDASRPSARSPETARRFLAVCGQDPPECDGGWLGEGEVRTMVVVGSEALVRMVTRHLGVRPGVDELPRAWGAPGEPRLIGTQQRAALEGATRDVFLALRPHAELSPAWLALRERGGRAAVVLVPTMRRVAPELSGAHGPLDKVEIVALDDALAVRDGASCRWSARRQGCRTIGAAVKAGNDAGGPSEAAKKEPKPPRHEQMRKTRGLELPPIRTWRDLRVCLLDETTVRLDGCGKYARFTALDLGLASRTTHKPTRAWEVLAMTTATTAAPSPTRSSRSASPWRGSRCPSSACAFRRSSASTSRRTRSRGAACTASKFIARMGVPEGTEGRSRGTCEGGGGSTLRPKVATSQVRRRDLATYESRPREYGRDLASEGRGTRSNEVATSQVRVATSQVRVATSQVGVATSQVRVATAHVWVATRPNEVATSQVRGRRTSQARVCDLASWGRQCDPRSRGRDPRW